MSLGLLLIVIGIVLAILVNYILGIILILVGLALIIVPRLSGAPGSRLGRVEPRPGPVVGGFRR